MQKNQKKKDSTKIFHTIQDKIIYNVAYNEDIDQLPKEYYIP